jgi:hypothetical protein
LFIAINILWRSIIGRDSLEKAKVRIEKNYEKISTLKMYLSKCKNEDVAYEASKLRCVRSGLDIINYTNMSQHLGAKCKLSEEEEAEIAQACDALKCSYALLQNDTLTLRFATSLRYKYVQTAQTSGFVSTSAARSHSK